PVRFAVRSLGWTEIAEEELTPEKSSRAVNRAIVDLSTGRNDLIDNVSKWGDGRELIMELDDHDLRLIDPDSLAVLHTQPIHQIRVWGVGRDNGRPIRAATTYVGDGGRKLVGDFLALGLSSLWRTNTIADDCLIGCRWRAYDGRRIESSRFYPKTTGPWVSFGIVRLLEASAMEGDIDQLEADDGRVFRLMLQTPSALAPAGSCRR
uniref:PID domain-containing protein n=1 Tax=Plectus sambesii TaxID=2011161 RepID=A0A914UQ88_9BILA